MEVASRNVYGGRKEANHGVSRSQFRGCETGESLLSLGCVGRLGVYP